MSELKGYNWYDAQGVCEVDKKRKLIKCNGSCNRWVKEVCQDGVLP